jgi:hypothetical protein
MEEDCDPQIMSGEACGLARYLDGNVHLGISASTTCVSGVDLQCQVRNHRHN